MKRRPEHDDELETKKIKLHIENNFSDVDIVTHGRVSASGNAMRYLRQGFTSSKFRPCRKLYTWGRLTMFKEDSATPVNRPVPMNVSIAKITSNMILTSKISKNVSPTSYLTADGRIIRKHSTGWVEVSAEENYERKSFRDITEYTKMYALNGK